MTGRARSSGEATGCRTRTVFCAPRSRADNARFERLLTRALPTFGGQAVSGSMTLARTSVRPRLVLHVNPVGVYQTAFAPRHAAAIVLVIDPGSRPRVDAELIAATLRLTPTEGRIAASLAEAQRARHCRHELAGGKLGTLARQADTPQAGHRPEYGPGTAGALDRRVCRAWCRKLRPWGAQPPPCSRPASRAREVKRALRLCWHHPGIGLAKFATARSRGLQSDVQPDPGEECVLTVSGAEDLGSGGERGVWGRLVHEMDGQGRFQPLSSICTVPNTVLASPPANLSRFRAASNRVPAESANERRAVNPTAVPSADWTRPFSRPSDNWRETRKNRLRCPTLASYPERPVIIVPVVEPEEVVADAEAGGGEQTARLVFVHAAGIQIAVGLRQLERKPFPHSGDNGDSRTVRPG